MSKDKKYYFLIPIVLVIGIIVLILVLKLKNNSKNKENFNYSNKQVTSGCYENDEDVFHDQCNNGIECCDDSTFCVDKTKYKYYCHKGNTCKAGDMKIDKLPKCPTTGNCNVENSKLCNYVCTEQNCKYPSTCENNVCIYNCLEDVSCKYPSTCEDNVCTYNCVEDTNCFHPSTCVDNICYDCTKDPNCKSPNTCVNNVCTYDCTKDPNCKSPNTCVNNVCTYDCTKDPNCKSPGMFCLNNVCNPSTYISSKSPSGHDCTTYSDTCKNPGNGICIPSSPSDQCTPDGKTCFANQKDCESATTCDKNNGWEKNKEGTDCNIYHCTLNGKPFDTSNPHNNADRLFQYTYHRNDPPWDPDSRTGILTPFPNNTPFCWRKGISDPDIEKYCTQGFFGCNNGAPTDINNKDVSWGNYDCFGTNLVCTASMTDSADLIRGCPDSDPQDCPIYMFPNSEYAGASYATNCWRDYKQTGTPDGLNRKIQYYDSNHYPVIGDMNGGYGSLAGTGNCVWL